MISKILQPQGSSQINLTEEAHTHAHPQYLAIEKSHASLLQIQKTYRTPKMILRQEGCTAFTESRGIADFRLRSISNMTVSLHLAKYHGVSDVFIIPPSQSHFTVGLTTIPLRKSKAYDIKSTLPRVLLSTTEKGQQCGDLLGMIDFSLRESNE